MKKIAVSRADFEEIIKQNFIYVDKTKYLHEIVNSFEHYYFLSRPRRFGKTLFLDTLKCFFEGKKDLFKGLYIYKQDWEWTEYPIVKLDFNILPAENRKILEKSIKQQFFKIAQKYDIELNDEEAYFMFPRLIEELADKYNKGVVILIDEYDKPIISHLGKGETKLKIARENQEFLKILYDNLKALEANLRMVFITGVSKFSKVSIFSTLNNLIELDMHPRFSDVLGYTEKELRTNFKEHFKQFANELKITEKELLKKFKTMYDGFKFHKDGPRVYNPYSVGKALDYKELDNYWFESGTPTFLVDLMKESDFDITNIENIEVGKNKLKAYDITKLKLIPLLFQTGYLTIKEVEDNLIYKLGYPNYEVENSLSQILLESLTEEKIDTPIIYRIKKSLINKEFQQFMEYMKSLFASIANINIPKAVEEREHFYHTIFYLTGVLLTDNNLKVESELLTSEGRIDMVVETVDSIFIIEFKCNQDAERAIGQIKEKNYIDKFRIKEKEIVLVGINFDSEQRNVKDFIIED